jgi:ABC-type antimicrobial peptide transport system permease subunit
MVLFGALKLLAAGLAAGFLLSAAVTTLLRGALFGVSPLDPWVYGQVGGLLLAVTVLAALLPAARAASVAPVRAMVEE